MIHIRLVSDGVSSDVTAEARSLVCGSRRHCMEGPSSQGQQGFWSDSVTSCWPWCRQAVQHWSSWLVS